MDLRSVRTFVTVAELGTVSSAALRMHIAQPALSRQISNLEQELGLRLFDRVGRRLILTSQGEELLGDCRGLLNYARALGEHAQFLRPGDAGILKVAASPHLIEAIFADFLHRYRQRYPRVQVKLIDTVGQDMLAMLESGDAHLGQSLARVIRPDDERFATFPLEPVDMLAACHPDVALGKEGKAEIGDLAPHQLLQIGSEFVLRRIFDAACRLAGLIPNILLESRAPHALLAMAEAGHGVAIIPSALRIHRSRLRIVQLTFRGQPLREPLAVLSDRRRPLPSYATAFCEMLAEHVREVFPITRPTEGAPGALSKRTAGRKGPRMRKREKTRTLKQ